MPLLPGADPLLVLALVLLSGTTFGWLAQRARLPAVTGQILAGVLLGPSVLAAFDPHAVHSLQPLTHFALALIGVTVGAHLNIARLRNAGRRLFWLLIVEAALTPLVVGSLLWLTGAATTLVLLLATLAVSRPTLRVGSSAWPSERPSRARSPTWARPCWWAERSRS
jgi:Kef-type K+ transport system membrane component KefB